MKDSARAVVIGGGIVGVGVLYHLAKAGWDAVLFEKDELTQGSTWHAAGLMPLYQMSYTIGQLHKYSVDLYQALEEETGQSVGFHKTGNLRIAATQGHLDEFRQYAGTANTIDVPYRMVTQEEIAELWPLANVDDLLGGIYHPDDGHVAPADVTQALAKGARNNGAKIYTNTQVTDIERKSNGEWLIHTSEGSISCEHVVSASGNHARETGDMIGLELPIIPVEHQYIVTDVCPQITERHEQGLPELPVLRDADYSYYLREERQGLILGPYEKHTQLWAVDGVPEGFAQQLLPPDYERLEPYIEACINRVPMFGEAGIKDCVNGPIPYTPDGAPLVGPAFGLNNFWLAEGNSFGITAAGGIGKYLVDWMVNGEPSIDMSGVDPTRFGDYANKNYAKAKNIEAYEHVFVTHYPLEERPAARPAKTPPCYDRLKENNAVFGQVQGWERANWFAPEGTEPVDVYSFRRTNFFEPVKEECLAVRNKVGLIDLTAFSKFRVSGPGAVKYLSWLFANRLPKTPGRINLAHALIPSGGVDSEFTITRTSKQSFYMISGSAAGPHDHDLLLRTMPTDGSVQVDNISMDYGVLVLAGPHARDVLSQLTDADLTNETFPWLTAKSILVDLAPVYAMRINFFGELGWELHHPLPYQNLLFDKLMEAGQDYDIKLFGTRALESLRLEKSYRMWGSELTNEYTLLEAGMDRFARLDKDDFQGKEALERQQQQGLRHQFVTLKIDANDADPFGNEPLYKPGEDKVIGRATSGGYAYALDTSMALGYVDPELAEPGTKLEIEILRERRPAEVVPESPYDPDNERLRA